MHARDLREEREGHIDVVVATLQTILMHAASAGPHRQRPQASRGSAVVSQMCAHSSELRAHIFMLVSRSARKPHAAGAKQWQRL